MDSLIAVNFPSSSLLAQVDFEIIFGNTWFSNIPFTHL